MAQFQVHAVRREGGPADDLDPPVPRRALVCSTRAGARRCDLQRSHCAAGSVARLARG
jgi:hypothetical protein